MPKRSATDSTQPLAAADSPTSKRAKLQDAINSPSLDLHQTSSSSSTPDILGADRLEHEGLVETGAVFLLEENAVDNDPDYGQSKTLSNGQTNGHDDCDGDDEDDGDGNMIQLRQAAPDEGYDDLYLDTINRMVLDFDFEKLCSVTLSNINVYACLVCGKYYQGRGIKSQAYFHALDQDHHVFINMESQEVYVLPEGYQVKSQSLDDIKFVVDPRLSRSQVMRLDKELKTAWDLSGRKYTPGFIGMNNIKANDYLNAVVQMLSHITPLRNFAMLDDVTTRTQLAQRFAILVRKIWNSRAFKPHVSPHELLQEVALCSNKKFTLTAQSDPLDFLSWFLNNLHLALGGSKHKPGTSIIHSVFQGTLQIQSQAITARADAGDRLRFEDADVHTNTTPYLLLALDLPATPLFQDELERNIIPQVPLTTILSKYDGVCAQEALNFRRRYRLLHPLPPYLIFHIKRFSTNKFVCEHNPTIVTFSPTDLDMRPYVVPNPALYPPSQALLYDLVANIVHQPVRVNDDSVEGEAEKKIWKCQVMEQASQQWFEIQDLFVEKLAAEILFTRESYIQVWARRRSTSKSKKTR